MPDYKKLYREARKHNSELSENLIAATERYKKMCQCNEKTEEENYGLKKEIDGYKMLFEKDKESARRQADELIKMRVERDKYKGEAEARKELLEDRKREVARLDQDVRELENQIENAGKGLHKILCALGSGD